MLVLSLVKVQAYRYISYPVSVFLNIYSLLLFHYLFVIHLTMFISSDCCCTLFHVQIGQYIASNGGVIAAEELAPYLDIDSMQELKVIYIFNGDKN